MSLIDALNKGPQPRPELDELHQRMRAALMDQLRHGIVMRAAGVADPDMSDLQDRTNALLNRCGDEWCRQCDDVFCIHGSGMHFHHDGCPSCAQEPEPSPDEHARLLLAHNRRTP